MIEPIVEVGTAGVMGDRGSAEQQKIRTIRIM